MTTPQTDTPGTPNAPLPAIAASPATSAPLNGLFCELHWGPELTTVRSFDAEVPAVLAAPDERAPVPLYGFDIPDAGWTLAERTPAGTYVIFPPPGTVASRRLHDGPPQPVTPTAGPDGRASLTLGDGERVTLTLPAKELRIELFPSVVKDKVQGLSLQRRLGVVAAIATAFILPLGFIFVRPDAAAIDEKNAKTLEEVRRKQEAQRKELEKAYPTYIDQDGKPVRPEDGLTLPSSLIVK